MERTPHLSSRLLRYMQEMLLIGRCHGRKRRMQFTAAAVKANVHQLIMQTSFMSFVHLLFEQNSGSEVKFKENKLNREKTSSALVMDMC